MKLKSVTKIKTLILAELYDSHYYRATYSHAKFIDACLQLKNDFPELFTIKDFAYNTVTIIINDGQLENVFKLYKHNEEKVIG